MKFAIVDIETTGASAMGNGITEIAILLHDGMNVTEEFHTLVNPLIPIPPFITRLTGISNAMVASAPEFGDISGKVHEMLTDNFFVAHNVGFDFSFVNNALKAHGYELNSKKICTVMMGRKFLPGHESYSLGKLCRSLGIDNDARHRAYGDARATVKVFEKILENGGEEFIRNKFGRKLKSG